MADTPVNIPIIATDQASSVFQKVSRNMGVLSKRLDGINKEISIGKNAYKGISDTSMKIGAGLTSIGQKMTVGLTLPIAAAGFAAVKTSADFETSLNDLRVRTGASAEDMKLLTAEARRLGTTTAFSAQEATEGMIVLGKAGMDTQQIMGATGAALNLAASEGIDMGQSAEFISDTLNQFKLNASEANRVADALAKTAGISSISISDLQNSMKYSAPIAATFGLKLEDLGGAVAVLGQLGIKGEMAGTAVRSLLTSITGDKERQAKLIARGLASDGSDFFEDKQMTKLKSLPVILERIKKANLSNTDVAEIFGKEFGSTIRTLIENSSMLADYTKQVGENAGFAAATGQARMKGFNGSVTLLTNAVKDLFIEFTMGEGGILETLTEWTIGLKNIVSWFKELSPGQKSFAKWTLGIVALAGPVVMGLGAIATAVGGISLAIGMMELAAIPVLTLLGPMAMGFAGITLAVTGLSAITVGIFRHWEDIVRLWTKAGNLLIDIDNMFRADDKKIKHHFLSDDIPLDQLAQMGSIGSGTTLMSQPFMPSAEPLAATQSIKESFNPTTQKSRTDDLIITLQGFPSSAEVKPGRKNESEVTVNRGLMMGGFGS